MLCESNCRVIEATTANILLKISSTKSNCKNFVRFLGAVRGNTVKPIVNIGVGGDGREDVVEVLLVGTLCGIITLNV
jgi:hypothetical protein